MADGAVGCFPTSWTSRLLTAIAFSDEVNGSFGVDHGIAFLDEFGGIFGALRPFRSCHGWRFHGRAAGSARRCLLVQRKRRSEEVPVSFEWCKSRSLNPAAKTEVRGRVSLIGMAQVPLNQPKKIRAVPVRTQRRVGWGALEGDRSHAASRRPVPRGNFCRRQRA